MYKFVLSTSLAAAVLLPVGSASAQARSQQFTRECDRSTDSKNAVYQYLTGKSVNATNLQLFTKGRKRLQINKSSLRFEVSSSMRAYWAATVSLPFTAVGSRARFSFKSSGKTGSMTVCHYALKSSARSWASFKPSDLKALFGRHMTDARPGERVSVRVGGKRPPVGYRTSTVLAVLAHPVMGNRYRIEQSLRSERR